MFSVHYYKKLVKAVKSLYTIKPVHRINRVLELTVLEKLDPELNLEFSSSPFTEYVDLPP